MVGAAMQLILLLTLLCAGCAFGRVPTTEGKQFFWFVGNKVETDVLKAESPSNLPTLINIGVQTVGDE